MIMRHKKTGGVYRVQMLVVDESTLTPSVVYFEEATATIWTRPASEFFDGRFEVFIPAKAGSAPMGAVH